MSPSQPLSSRLKDSYIAIALPLPISPHSALQYHPMRVTKWGEFGILCCLFLARKGSAVGEATEDGTVPTSSTGAAEIAQVHQLPLDYAQQILHRLRKGGVIASIRGPRGGFYLSRPASQISLKEILQAAEGDTFSVICEHNGVNEGCSNPSMVCGLRAVWHELQDEINRFLASRNLQDLIDRESASGMPQIFSNLVAGPTSSLRQVAS